MNRNDVTDSAETDASPVMTPSPGQVIQEILNGISPKAGNLFQVIKAEVFPLLYKEDTAVKMDVFRLIKTRFGLLASEMKTLDIQLFHFQNQRKLEEIESEQKAVMTPEREEAALDLLKSPQLFDRFRDDLKSLGLSGESANALILYLVCLSTRMVKPLHAAVFGVSSGGKTSVVKHVLSLIPDDAKLVLGSASTRAFEYMDEELIHEKTLFIEEFEGLKDTLATLRVILSETTAARAVVKQNPRTNSFETEIHTTRHKFSLITTTTRQFIEHETANRMLFAHIDQKRTHIKEVSGVIRGKHTIEEKSAVNQREELRVIYQVAYGLLQTYEVHIPYALYISFPNTLARHNRDLEKFLCLIEVIAFVRQFQRETITRDGTTFIQANLDDYRLAYQLMPQALAEAFEELDDDVVNALRLAIEYVTDVINNSTLSRDEVKITTRLIRDLGIEGDYDLGDQTKVAGLLTTLEFLGLLYSPSPSKQGSRRHYYLPDDVYFDPDGNIVGLRPSLLNKVSTPEELEYRIKHQIPGVNDLPEDAPEFSAPDDERWKPFSYHEQTIKTRREAGKRKYSKSKPPPEDDEKSSEKDTTASSSEPAETRPTPSRSTKRKLKADLERRRKSFESWPDD